MPLNISRQLRRCPSPGGLRHRRQQIQFVRKLTKKQRRLFRQNRQFFIPQLRRRFGLGALLANQSSLVQFRSQLSASLWYFRNPSIVPGVVILRKFKRLFYRQHSSVRALKTWLSGTRLHSLQKILREVGSLNSKGFSSWHFIIALENRILKMSSKTPGTLNHIPLSLKQFSSFFNLARSILILRDSIQRVSKLYFVWQSI